MVDPSDIWLSLDQPNVDTIIEAYYKPLDEWLAARFKSVSGEGIVSIVWVFDRVPADVPHTWVRKAGENDKDANGDPRLAVLLHATRRDWKDDDIYKVLQKLRAINIDSTRELLEAVDAELRGFPTGVNARLNEHRLKAFNDKTVRLLHSKALEMLGLEPPKIQAADDDEEIYPAFTSEAQEAMTDFLYPDKTDERRLPKPVKNSGFQSKASARKAAEWEAQQAAIAAQRQAALEQKLARLEASKVSQQRKEPQAPARPPPPPPAPAPQDISLEDRLAAAFQWTQKKPEPVVEDLAEEEEEEDEDDGPDIEPYVPDPEELAEMEAEAQEDFAVPPRPDVTVSTVWCRAGHPLHREPAPRDVDCDLCGRELERVYDIVWHCVRCQYALCEHCHDEKLD
mmetsp:Transcript_48507/g.105892  ORF Transcript_48507/g.105892 Transcript_48507/m.105892 type:complete len:397 (-) Transcript_48507:30-1220(-)